MEKTFDEMTNEEFETYLQEKYGNRWQVISLTDEELKRVKPLAEEVLERALKEGQEARRAFEESWVPPYIDPGTRFR